MKNGRLRRALREAGFYARPGRGSHEVWEHSEHAGVRVVLAGRDGDDAKPYQVRRVQKHCKGVAGSLR